MPRKIDQSLIDEACEMVISGFTLKDAANKIGFHPDIVSKHIRGRGVVIPKHTPGGHNKINYLPDDKIIAAYTTGRSELSLSIQYDVSRAVIRKILIEKNIPIRTGSEANCIRMGAMSTEDRRKLVSPARSMRIAKMIRSAENGAKNSAIGIGEVEVSRLLENIGHNVTRQKEIGAYLVDISIGNMAVEIKFNSRGLIHRRKEREKKIIERGYFFVYVVFNVESAFSEKLNDIVRLIDFTSRNPPPIGKYRVIRCNGKTTPAEIKFYDRPAI